MILNTPQKQIDHVLQIIKDHGSFLSFEEINGKVKNSTIVVEPTILRMILEKLERDKHLFLDHTKGSKYYSVSFEGYLFEGYEAKALKDANDALLTQMEIDRQRTLDALLATNSTRLNTLTNRLAIGSFAAFAVAAALLIWQVTVYFWPPHVDAVHVILQK